MVIPLGYDPQNDVALITCGTWHVAQRLVATQAYAEHLSGLHTLQPQFGTDESHWADFACDIDGLVHGGRKRIGHVPNYTAPACRCRLFCDA